MIALAVFSIFFLTSLLWQLFRWSILSNPSNQQVLRLVDQELRAYVEPNKSTLVDLGSGVGTTLWFFHQREWAKLIGVEGFTPVFALAFFFQKFFGLSRLEFKRGDYRRLPIEGTVFFAYISPGAMKDMQAWLYEKQPHFEWLVTHTFSLPGVKPARVLRANDLYCSPIYFYKRAQIFDQPRA